MREYEITLLTEGCEYVKTRTRELIFSFWLWSVVTTDAEYGRVDEYEQEHCGKDGSPQIAGEGKYHSDECVVSCVIFPDVYRHSENIRRY